MYLFFWSWRKSSRSAVRRSGFCPDVITRNDSLRFVRADQQLLTDGDGDRIALILRRCIPSFPVGGMTTTRTNPSAISRTSTSTGEIRRQLADPTVLKTFGIRREPSRVSANVRIRADKWPRINVSFWFTTIPRVRFRELFQRRSRVCNRRRRRRRADACRHVYV